MVNYKSMDFKYDLKDLFHYEKYEENEKLLIKIPNKIIQNKSMLLPSKLLFNNNI